MSPAARPARRTPKATDTALAAELIGGAVRATVPLVGALLGLAALGALG